MVWTERLHRIGCLLRDWMMIAVREWEGGFGIPLHLSNYEPKLEADAIKFRRDYHFCLRPWFTKVDRSPTTICRLIETHLPFELWCSALRNMHVIVFDMFILYVVPSIPWRGFRGNLLVFGASYFDGKICCADIPPRLPTFGWRYPWWTLRFFWTHSVPTVFASYYPNPLGSSGKHMYL